MGDEFDSEPEFSTRKPKTGKFRDTSQRLRQGKEKHLGHRASLDWRLDRDRVCDPAYESSEDVALDHLRETISKSRTGETLLTGDSARGLEIHYDPQTLMSQLYPQGDVVTIVLNPHRPRGNLLNMLVKELRHVWQYRQGALVNPMAFEPDEAVLVNRAQQADALMIAVKVAWELKLLGETESWDYLIGSPLGDVTRTFEIHAQKDFRTLNNGMAARATYDKFFEGARTKGHDKRIIHQMLLDDSGYMRAQQKPEKASMELFSKLGEMPHGRNYLSGTAAKRQPMDMCYSVIEDRANANFLWFIKFERNFQEKELEMMQESVKASGEVVDLAKWAMRQNRDTPQA